MLQACSTIDNPPLQYVGLPSHLLVRCVVNDIQMETVRDVVESRAIYKEAFETCAARVDATIEYDRKARKIIGGG